MPLRHPLARLALALLPAFASLTPTAARAADEQQSGWLAWFNTVRVNEQLGLVSDLQLRSRDEWAGPRNLLVRPGLSWYVAPGQSLTLGYAYIGSYNLEAPDATEHRIWQQYLSTYTLAGAKVSQRLRLEQRFIGRPGAPDLYSDRFRWFSRVQVPLASGPSFSHGAFLALQNEAFVNLSHRDDLDAPFFDQNRAYVAIGWRHSPTVDVEVGYLNQWMHRRGEDVVNHVLQVAVYTSFQR